MSEKSQHLGLGCRTPPWAWATFQSKVLCSMNLPAHSNTDLQVKGRGSVRLVVPGTGFRERQVFLGNTLVWSEKSCRRGLVSGSQGIQADLNSGTATWKLIGNSHCQITCIYSQILKELKFSRCYTKPSALSLAKLGFKSSQFLP